MISAIIVLYNPDLNLLDQMITKIQCQVDLIIIVDNTENPIFESSPIIINHKNYLKYIPLNKNWGIATAQNIGIKYALEKGADHVLLLDQDSCPSEDMVKCLLSAEFDLINMGHQIGAIGPLFTDNISGTSSLAIIHGNFYISRSPVKMNSRHPVESDYIISSGSLIQRSTLATVGFMREELFIDFVDIEWGLRAKWHKYKSFIIPSARMFHNLGDSSITMFGQNISLHNDFRNYHIVRNATYLTKIQSMGWKWRLLTIPRIPKYIILYSWLSKNKLKTFRLLLTGFFDGAVNHMTRFYTL